ncbi:Cell wall-associated hydrolase, NlpC family [Prauserella marina]|uniref:Cell wall-associated hydrolase, NlpC family n=1 Tax=Prauserella marina TaxID=530584 RepID=A0A1G6RUA0_9PSEU|nr:cell wall-associated NlpC family hydrolase [Prauserella marina]SDD08013.1 Cell wall-associated hydrolase, NlpC family [Prauserella marina]
MVWEWFRWQSPNGPKGEVAAVPIGPGWRITTPAGPRRTARAAGGATGVRRGVVVGSLAIASLLGVTGTGMAVPPPPDNPTDAELAEGRQAADDKANEVGELTSSLAQAESRLADLRTDVEFKMEQANKALVDLQAAQEAASDAEAQVAVARQEADAAAADIESARAKLDKFIAGSYQQGSTIGSVSAYLGSETPKDLLARSQLLQAVGGSELHALEGMQQARIEKSNKDAAAREAYQIAQERKGEAESAKTAADAARATAIAAQRDQADRTKELEAERSRVEDQLSAAQADVDGLEGQRAQYEDWLAQKQREEEERAAAAAAAAASSGSGGTAAVSAPAPAPAPSAPVGAGVETVIARAMSQLGVTYAWGGGNASGPTYGIRDGGVADSYGDYMKVGFDCSGLMIYAFAGVKALPHYSGYQYTSGRQVPLSQMQRGDMLFWGPGGIHHVALYLGNGQMIEAPYSGGVVRVAPVRYGDIMPYATRLIG